MTSNHIINVSEASFEFEVINYSQNVPVVVDFWAPWCRPCKTMEPILEKIVGEYSGAFRIARVNVDENPNLAIRFSVRSIPTLKSFVNGQVMAEMVGAQPENRIREFIEKISPPSPITLALEKANSLLSEHDWRGAEEHFLAILEQHQEQTAAMLGIAKAFLGQGKSKEAYQLINNFPASRQFSEAELLIPYARSLLDLEMNRLPDKTDLDATFHNCLGIARRGNLPAALDGLLEILRQDRHYQDDLARKVFLGLLSLMGDEDKLTRQYRSELSTTLF